MIITTHTVDGVGYEAADGRPAEEVWQYPGRSSRVEFEDESAGRRQWPGEDRSSAGPLGRTGHDHGDADSTGMCDTWSLLFHKPKIRQLRSPLTSKFQYWDGSTSFNDQLKKLNSHRTHILNKIQNHLSVT